MKQILTILILANLITAVAVAEELRVPTAVKEEPTFTSQDLSKLVPTNMPATTNDKEVGLRIADQSMDALMNTETVRAMPVTKVVQKLDVQQGIKFGSKENGTEHKLGLRVLALQRMARLEYSGFLNAQAVFSAADKSIDFNVVEELTQKSKLLINMNSLNQTGTANIQWEWP